jgi:hypothetical protein
LQDHQKEFDKVVIDKDKEISRLKEHSQKLLAQTKKSMEDEEMGEGELYPTWELMEMQQLGVKYFMLIADLWNV